MTTTARRRTKGDKERGRQGHEQVSGDGDVGERCKKGDGQEESDDASKGWSGNSAEDLVGSEREEEAMDTGGWRGVGGRGQ